MKSKTLIWAVVISACGTDPVGPGPVEPDCRALSSIDRVSLLGPGDSRPVVFLAQLDGAVEWVAVDLGSSLGKHGRAALDHGRLVALTSGQDVLDLELGACRTSIEIDVYSSPPFAREVLSFVPGAGAGFGADRFPEVVLGPPQGAGRHAGSVDVLSLGVGGEITLGFGDLIAYDGPGPDLLVFENAFLVPGTNYGFAEPAEVALGRDGIFEVLPCDASGPPYVGCVGSAFVLAGAGQGAPVATDPAEAGGDPIELRGHTPMVDALRLRDVTTATTGDNSGFDLDAVALIHAIPRDAIALSCAPAALSLRLGQRALLPRVDVELSGGRTMFGVEAQAEIRSGRAIEIDESGVLATEVGVAEIEIVIGGMTANCKVMVEQ